MRIGRGIIESINEDERSVLVSFIDGSIPDPPLTGEPLRDESIMREDIRRRLQSVIARPHQLRFANAVFARYGRRCAVCPLTQRELLDAAHIRAKSDRGSDSPGNGLPLCANHHRAFDRGLWAIRPEDHRLVAAAGTELGRLGIAEHSLLHGRPQPAAAAIAAQWAAFSRAQRG
ncbi:HNH endonuclease [Mycetocola spongiae]|uniref:HNH endonuclease n=1 Tax=Mycetocola spongiae TaxID=2859226 RepID=UPI001CF24435|nr:HNH endonuclease [Mycetocola spongiae]UCR88474.1 HNH endonuclease [Mycetocola spongiae]